ncbi:zinc finger A20 and AN1 domain-containing stress-associated protein 1-like [Rhododendron vialii]|uniref:zinc finger A20 and AN1 domain-containing stress-associated protein 1-like n=1 Tax=Rhododendron vialii TaxID=182163 RepID=UPI002660572F|nr:zinc finger A20 and AN1 domain-containing stress-associated protein 1-like [Rhododendron vialii]
MGSEGIQESEPKLCKNGCGFFSTSATMNLCSKCYRDLRGKEEQAVSDKKASTAKLDDDDFRVFKAHVASLLSPSTGFESMGKAAPKRCSSCNKKVGLVGFLCRCGATFCGAHRYPEEHECKFDFKAVGKDTIARDNPVVKADKVVRF